MGRLIQYNSQVAKHHPNGSTHIITYSVNILPLHMQGKPGRVFRHALGKNKKIAQNHIEARVFRNALGFSKLLRFSGDRAGPCRTVSPRATVLITRVFPCRAVSGHVPKITLSHLQIWECFGGNMVFRLISHIKYMQHILRSLYKLKFVARWITWTPSAKVKVNGPTGTPRAGPKEKC